MGQAFLDWPSSTALQSGSRSTADKPAIMTFIATLEFDATRTPEVADRIVDQLSDFAAALSTSDTGGTLVRITVDAPSVAIAAQITLGLARDVQFQLRRIEVLSTADFDRRLHIGPLDDVVSGKAAAALGVSTQAIRQRLEAGTLTGRKAGRTWHVSRAAVAAAQARHKPEPGSAGHGSSRRGPSMKASRAKS